VVLGTFYVLARFRFFYDPSKPEVTITSSLAYDRWNRWFNKDRQDSLVRKMGLCGLSWKPRLWAWTDAVVEVGAGLLLIIGLYAPLMAFALFVVTALATRCTWRQKVYEQNPCDALDVCACYLWRVEGLYLIIAACIIFGGGGAFALSDYV
jgi:uncharacterized membrane protein YphA (DoxX/SURF4 family)